ncbi:gamma-glutamyl-gamma-aminobutyrate hydrolase family protein [Rhizomonospora bruguierae]|uniref:gamma-glutamyl-gamma-aminobutyrate hydrolase family protein n=1 Tax=Rhizomonospora bruguierae TaxID=1581705 RepID=UPI001BCE30DF|nr:gamma-glutamyl-gamma-aminobutyrate hydrolase family protein [Micromonospora sp. NBRC 107566]
MDAEQSSSWLREFLHTLAKNAAAAAEAAGAQVVLVDAARPLGDPADLVRDADGVLILGGADLDPATYGQPRRVRNLYGLDAAADAFELGLARAALDAGRPVLGICRGMQVLNVAAGGSLIQDLGPGTMHNIESDNSTMTTHGIGIIPGTLLAGICGRARLDVRSGHHQAVDAVGAGLRVCATASDGIIEAIEGTEGWALGVQWHPEDPDADPGHLATLMTAFTTAANTAQTRR